MKAALLTALLAATASAQSFDVASIRPCAPGTRENPGLHNNMADFAEPGGRLNARATNIAYLLEWAYNIQPAQHSPGPDWMATDCYDLSATTESGATPEQIKQRTRTLLEDRFQLKSHREKRSLPAIVISLGKSAPKLTPSNPDDVHTMGASVETGPDQKVTAYHVNFTRWTLGQLNDTFARLLNRVLVDRTGIPGEFTFTLTIAPDATRPNPMDPTLLITALREDLGLKLDSQDAEVEYMVIDDIQRPSEN